MRTCAACKAELHFVIRPYKVLRLTTMTGPAKFREMPAEVEPPIRRQAM